MKLPIEFIGGYIEQAVQIPAALEVSQLDCPLVLPEVAGLCLEHAATRLSHLALNSAILDESAPRSLASIKASSLGIAKLDLGNTTGVLTAISDINQWLQEQGLTNSKLVLAYRNLSDLSYSLELDVKEYEKQFKELLAQYQSARDAIQELKKSLSYLKSYSKDNVVTTKNDTGSGLNFLLNTIPDLDHTYDSLALIIPKLSSFMGDTEDLHSSYTCYVSQLNDALAKFSALYQSLYQECQVKWLRLIGGSYIKEGNNIEFNRSCGVITISARLPTLPECPPVEYLHVPPPQFIIYPGPENDCPECENPPKLCRLKVIDDNANKIIDDDLDLYIDGKFVKTFIGSVDAKSEYKIDVESGTHKFEFRFKKANGRNTAKQVSIVDESGKYLLNKEQVECYSDSAIGAVVWTKKLDVKCDDTSTTSTTTTSTKPPIEPCFCHMTGGLMGGRYISGTMSKIFVKDAYSDLVYAGEYDNAASVFSTADSASFDALALGAGTSLVVYANRNFTGEIVFQGTGPLVLNNGKWKATYETEVMEDYPDSVLQSVFPQSVRKWSESDMNSWASGSLKVMCGALST